MEVGVKTKTIHHAIFIFLEIPKLPVVSRYGYGVDVALTFCVQAG